MARIKKISGIGDVVATVTKTFGIQPCNACIERQNKWNISYPLNLQSREVTVKEWQQWKDLNAKEKNSLDAEEVVYVCKFYASVFNRPYFHHCAGCSPKPINEMINQLNKLYETN